MPEHLHLEIEHRLEAASAARRAVRAWGAVPEALRWSAELVCGELLANGVRHGLAPVQLDIDADDAHIRIAVSDGAPTIGPPSATSRGLGIVGSVTDQWGVDYGPGGKTVWAEMATPGHALASTAPRSYLGSLIERAEADQLRRIYDFAPIGIAITDWRGRFLRCNPAYCTLLGYSEAELLTRDFASLVHPDDRAGNVADVNRLQSGEVASFEVENRYVHKDGHPVWVHKAVMRLTDEGGESGQIVAIVSDISDRTAAEAALRASESRLRATFQNAAAGIGHVDLTGRLFRCNRKLCEILGYSREELEQRTFREITHPDDLAGDEERLARLLRREIDSYEWEKRYIRKDGSPVWVHISASAVYDSPTDGTYIVGVIEDISRRKAAELALQARAEAERRARGRAELTMEVFRALERIEGVRPRAQLLCDILAARGVGVALLHCEPALGKECVFATRDRPRTEVSEALGRVLPSTPDEIATALGASDVVHVPVDSGAAITATLTLIDNTNGLIDQVFLRELADRIGVLLASARVREEEHTIALRLQQALLPGQLPHHPALRIRARYRASGEVVQVGGDWYDAFALGEGLIGFTVGDVVGHGLDAASSMGRLRTAAAALAPRSTGPGELLAHLDEFAQGPNGTSFATATFAVLDPATRVLRYASAGHLPALVVEPDGRTHWLDDGRSGPLAAMGTQCRPEASTRIAPGSLVLWYSDGLVERRGEPIDHGLHRFAKTVSACRTRPLDAICDAVIDSLTAQQHQEDDIVLLCMRLAA